MNATVTEIGTHANWRAFAACKDEDPALFTGPDAFRTEPARSKSARERRARNVCASCPVAAECLDFAIEAGIKHGVFGGTTEDERPPAKTGRLARERAGNRSSGLGRGRTAGPRKRGSNGQFATDPAFCASGRHPRTEAATGARGNCLACRREREGSQAA